MNEINAKKINELIKENPNKYVYVIFKEHKIRIFKAKQSGTKVLCKTPFRWIPLYKYLDYKIEVN